MKTLTLKIWIFIVALGLVAANTSAQIGNTRYGDFAYPSFTGGGNSAFGAYSLNANTNGNYNTAIGTASLYHNTSGSSNTAIGRWSLYSNTSGLSNTSLGAMSLYLNTAGVENTAIGTNSMNQNTWGSYNTASGVSSLNKNTSGLFNTAQGAYSLFNNYSGGDNTASGAYSLYSNGQGADNVASGMYALYSNVSGNSNTAIGSSALSGNNSGSNNTAIGYNAGSGIYTGSNNTIIGANVTGLPAALSNTIILADGSGNQRLYIDNTGKTRIGDATLTMPGTYKLFVKDGILTEKVVVAVANSAQWADYVFASDYKLMSLQEVSLFVKKHHHLPNVPAATEVVKNGLNLGTMDAKLLEKIEELTLYLIEQNNQNMELINKNASLLKELDALKSRVTDLEIKR